jgi:release factor glutamine methyltransferase
MTIEKLLHEATQAFEAAGIPSARLDAEVLLAFCLGCDRLEFYKSPDRRINEPYQILFQNLIARRQKWEPVAYITGHKEFWSFTLEVNNNVLIPRPDTEIIVEEALSLYRQVAYEKSRILDIGTGSGAIAIALAKEIPHAQIIATDISSTALEVACKNARDLNVANRIDFRLGDLFEPVDGVFDLIVSNPPYIAAEEYEKLPTGVKSYEPKKALLAGKSGMEFYEKLVYQADNYLKNDAWLLLEIGASQEQGLCKLMENAKFYDQVTMRTDYAGLPRVMKARRKSSG